MAGVVYEGVGATTGDTGKLFAGQRFWFSSAVPQRKWLIENAIANGAEVVQLEKQANVCLVDHARKNAPINSHSYRYIEQSIRNGRLENLDDHRVGLSKATHRPVGSMVTAPKVSRAKFTEEEDQMLWNFIKPYENAGGTTAGNEIYKQLEEAHGTGRHTYQSWRDRWLKHVRHHNRQITGTLYNNNTNVADEDVEEEQEVQAASSTAPMKRPQQPPPSNRTRIIATASDRETPSVRMPPPQQSTAPQPHRALGTSAPGAQPQVAQGSSSHEDFQTLKYRQALERKLGIVQPINQSPSTVRTSSPTPQSSQRAALPQDPSPTRTSQLSQEEFLEEEYDLLMGAAKYIISVGEGDNDESWDQMHQNYPNHSATAWKEFWQQKVKPDYLKKTVHIKEEQMSQDDDAGEGFIENQSDSVSEEDQVASVQLRSRDLFVSTARTTDDHANLRLETATPQSSEGLIYACRWLDCQEEFSDRTSLSRHVAKSHKPTEANVEANGGFACFWDDCAEAVEDENGDARPLTIQSREAWVKHYVNHHIKYYKHLDRPVTLDGLANTAQRVKGRSKNRMVIERPSLRNSTDSDSNFDPTASSKHRHEHDLVDGASDQQDDGTDDDGDESTEESGSQDNQDENEVEDFETTPSSSTSETENEEQSSTNDADEGHTRRHSTRLENIPRPPYMADSSFNYVDKAVGSSPPLLPQPNPTVGGSFSPHFQSSPVANEARKRSPGKGNSQESSKVNSQESAEGNKVEPYGQAILSSLGKRPRAPELQTSSPKSPRLPPSPNYERIEKRRKQNHNREEPVEIPSTPDARKILGELRNIDDDDVSSMLNGSPTPRPRSRYTTLPAETALSLDETDQDAEHTSPLRLSMLSDPEIPPSSPAHSSSTHRDDLSSEADLQFETARETPTANLWGTAPFDTQEEEDGVEEENEEHEDQDEDEDAGEEEEIYETAMLERWPRSINKGKGRARVETPSLDEDPDYGLEYIEANERQSDKGDEVVEDDQVVRDGPSGSLEEFSMPTSYQLPHLDEDDVDLNESEEDQEEEEEQPSNDEDDEDNRSSTSASTTTGSIASPRRWVTKLQSRNPTLNQAALLVALNATSAADKTLTWQVYRHLVDSHQDGDNDNDDDDDDDEDYSNHNSNTLPPFTKGCWTEDDDAALRGGERWEVARVRAKHGAAGVKRRVEWLGLE